MPAVLVNLWPFNLGACWSGSGRLFPSVCVSCSCLTLRWIVVNKDSSHFSVWLAKRSSVSTAQCFRIIGSELTKHNSLFLHYAAHLSVRGLVWYYRTWEYEQGSLRGPFIYHAEAWQLPLSGNSLLNHDWGCDFCTRSYFSVLGIKINHYLVILVSPPQIADDASHTIKLCNCRTLTLTRPIKWTTVELIDILS